MARLELTPTDFHPIITPDTDYPLGLYGSPKGLQAIFELGKTEVQIAYELALGIPREAILTNNNRKAGSTKIYIWEIYQKLFIPSIQRMVLPTLVMNGLVQSAETPDQIFPVTFNRYEPLLPDRHIHVDEDKLVNELCIPKHSTKIFALAIIGSQLSEICNTTSQGEANVLKRLSQSYQQGITLENGLAICLRKDIARLVTSPA